MQSDSASHPVPVVESLGRACRRVSGLSIVGAVAWPVIAVAWHGSAALDLDAYLPWSSAAYPRKPIPIVVPCRCALPLLLRSGAAARSDRARGSSRWFLRRGFTFARLKVLPSGVVSPGWSLRPLRVVIAAVAFGPWSGLAMAGAEAAGLGLCAW